MNHTGKTPKYPMTKYPKRLPWVFGHWVFGCFSLCLCVSVVHSAEPAIRNLALRGLQIGGTTTLVVDGDEFGTAPRLLLPFAARQQLKPGTTKNQATFDVTLAADVEAGYYQLRVVTDEGVSAPMLIAVDRLPQRLVPVAMRVNTQPPAIEQLPAAVHGVVNGGATVETRFTGKAGQKIMVEVEAQRLGSKLRPVVHLFGARRLQLAWAWPNAALGGDARLEATLPEDGTYTMGVHDVEYAPPGPGFFRLRVGQWSFVDQVFPPAVEKGKAQAVELLGPVAAARVNLAASRGLGALPMAFPKDGLFSGPRPFVLISPHAELVKDAAAGKVQDLPAGAVGVSGRLLTAHAEDRYRVPVLPKTKLRLEVFAERLGSPLDAALVVRNEQGTELARVEDGPMTLDPVLEYAVPDKVTAVIVGVVDSQGQGGPRGVYRLVVEPHGAAKTGFQLFTPAQHLALPVGGRTVVPVLIDRGGYEGRVQLSAEGLPAGMRLEGADIPEGADGALVTVQRGQAAAGAAISRWVGRAANGEEGIVTTKGHPLQRLQPWLATELAVATTTAKGADFQIDWRGLAADAGLVPAKKLVLPVKVTRPAVNGVVRLTLLTSQLRPQVNGQLDQNQALRLEKPVELPAPLPTRPLDADLTILVPPQPLAPVYDVTVQAELLSPDRRTVLAVAHAPVRRMLVRHSVVVRLDGPARIETTLDSKKGATVKVTGQVERREGLTGDVALALTGLPAGTRADAVTVKAGTTAFTLNVTLPLGFPAGEIAGLTLSGTAAPDAKQPNIRVRSRDVQLTLAVRMSAAKPWTANAIGVFTWGQTRCNGWIRRHAGAPRG